MIRLRKYNMLQILYECQIERAKPVDICEYCKTQKMHLKNLWSCRKDRCPYNKINLNS